MKAQSVAIKQVSPIVILFVMATLAFSRLGMGADSLLAALALTIMAIVFWERIYGPKDTTVNASTSKPAKTAKASANANPQSTYDFWLITELISLHSLAWARDENAAHVFKYKGVEVLGITPDALFVFSFANGQWSKSITRIDSAHKMLLGSCGAIDMIDAALKKNAPKPVVQTNQNGNSQNNQNRNNNQNQNKGNNNNGNNGQNNKRATQQMPAVQTQP